MRRHIPPVPFSWKPHAIATSVRLATFLLRPSGAKPMSSQPQCGDITSITMSLPFSRVCALSLSSRCKYSDEGQHTGENSPSAENLATEHPTASVNDHDTSGCAHMVCSRSHSSGSALAQSRILARNSSLANKQKSKNESGYNRQHIHFSDTEG